MADTAINCRATAAFVTDTSPETYSLANTDSAYPVSRGGFTFGYTTVYGDAERDRNSSVDRRLAGLHQRPNNTAGQSVFRIDVTAGTYTLYAAFGDTDNDQIQYFEVFDNSTSLYTVTNVSTTADNFADANGTVWSRANWPGSNTGASVNISSGIFIIKYGKGGSGTNNSTMCHLRLSPSGGGTTVKQLAAMGVG